MTPSALRLCEPWLLKTKIKTDLSSFFSRREDKGKPSYDSRSDILSDTFNQYFKEIRPALGFGLQHQLPVGPARTDFAISPDNDSDRDEDFFVIHFSVGMSITEKSERC